ncbi:MAG: PKD domain-containing protein [Candidatus Cyclobacteriaceae bacterium M2_1C_046]
MKNLNFLIFWIFCVQIAHAQIISNQQLNLKPLKKPVPALKPGHFNVPSQRTCYTDEYTKLLQDKYKDYPSTEDFESRLQSLMVNGSSRTTEDILIIPVVIHVVHNGESIGVGANISQAQIQSQIDVLNEDFRRTGPGSNSHPAGADTNIEFVLAVLGPDGNELPEPGINRINGGAASWEFTQIENTLKPGTIWDPTKYFNMWTLEFGGEDAELLGYAQFPNLSGLDGIDRSNGAAETDGVVVGYRYFGRTGNVSSPYDEGRTTTHEVGHWLGLRHIWGDGGCAEDDFCTDTPAAGQPNYSCITANSCDEGVDDQNDMIENYMDYTPDACMNIFTVEQKGRMRTVLANSPRRMELVNSTVGEATDKPVAQFSTNTPAACSGTSVSFTDESTNSPTSWKWNFYDGSGTLLATFTEQNLAITFNQSGVYTITFTATNASGSDSVTNQLSIYSDVVMSSVYEDIEDENNILNEWVVLNTDNDRGWLYTNSESAYGTGTNSLVFDNYSVDTDPTGTIDVLVSPLLDLSGSGEPYLSFDHAYAIYSQDYLDSLQVMYSLDCGATWNLFWSEGGDDLATSAATENPFEPTDTEWRSNEFSLSFLAGEPSVHVALVNRSGWGNLLYLDNIKFSYVQVSQPAQAAFSSNKIKICEGDAVQFEDQSTGTPGSWSWILEGADPGTSIQQHPKVTYSTAGLYNVSLTASNILGGTMETKVDYIEVIPLPQMQVEGSQTICEGDEVTLTASGGSNIKWLSRGSVIFEGPTYSFSAFEDVTLQVVGENELGCQGAVDFTVSVVSIPETVATSNVAGLCEAGNITLTGTGASSYEWYIGNTLAGTGASIQLVLEQTTTYTLLGFSPEGTCSSSTEITVELFDVIQPVINLSGSQLICSDASAYQWYYNGVEIQGATSKNYSPLEEGNYSVSVVDFNGCLSVSEVFSYTILDVNDTEGDFSIYPNPVNNKLYLTGADRYISFKIFTYSGLLVKNGQFYGEGEFINVQDLKEGVYLLEIYNSSGENKQIKFVKH